jgi:hypothetical protein
MGKRVGFGSRVGLCVLLMLVLVLVLKLVLLVLFGAFGDLMVDDGLIVFANNVDPDFLTESMRDGF